MGSDALRGREAETRLCPDPAASAGHRRARRGDLRARSRQPGQIDGAFNYRARCDHDRERRSSPGARGLPQPQDRARAPAGWCPLRHRHQFDSAARPQTPLGTMAADAAGAGEKYQYCIAAERVHPAISRSRGLYPPAKKLDASHPVTRPWGQTPQTIRCLDI